MNVTVEKKPTRELIPTPVPQQTPFWADFKRNLGVPVSAFDIHTSSNGSDDLLVLYQHAGDDACIGYVPYGPASLEPEDSSKGALLEQVSESLRRYVDKRCIALRFDLAWESPWARESDAYGTDGDWLGPPKPEHQEIRLNFTTENWNLHKAQTDILPSDTFFVDLGSEEQVIRSRMKTKTRYNIGLSHRRGVRVRPGVREDLPIWYELYTQTCRRNGIFLHDVEFFSSLFETEDHKQSQQQGIELLIAEAEGKPAAAMFLLYSGQRATYLYGASSNESRKNMPAYALQWEAIRRAKSFGCTSYDLFGTAPTSDPSHPMHGLHRFKKGFGGSEYHRMGCWDYPLDTQKYALYQASEMMSQGYHLS
jgi:lipid II:glycine glycyltransferase (peptidoglycan interpeptide bridge formation enzyme)